MEDIVEKENRKENKFLESGDKDDVLQINIDEIVLKEVCRELFRIEINVREFLSIVFRIVKRFRIIDFIMVDVK